MAGRKPLPPGKLGSVRLHLNAGGTVYGRAYARDAGGARRHLMATGPTEEAVRAELERQASALISPLTARMSAESPLSVAFQIWLSESELNVKPQSLRIYRDTVRWLDPMIGGLPIGSFNVSAVKGALHRVQTERSEGAVDHASRG